MTQPGEKELGAVAQAPEEEGPERSVLWGRAWDLEGSGARLVLGDFRCRVSWVQPDLLCLAEEGAPRPPLWVKVTETGGRLRLGHLRRRRPVIVRFPRPILLAPQAALTVYSTYPTKLALFYEAPSGTRLKLTALPERRMKATWYGDPSRGLLCHLHYGPASWTPEELGGDRLHAAVRFRLSNRSAEGQQAGIVLLDPPALDFYHRDGRLCLNVVELHIFSGREADLYHPREPSIEGAELVDARRRDAATGPGRELLRQMMGQRAMEQGI